MTEQNVSIDELSIACRLPSFFHAMFCFAGVLLLISLGLFVWQASLHALIFLALIWVSIQARGLGHSFAAIRRMMDAGVTKALPAIYIFLLIGMVIASFMQSGTIASLLYYGLDWLNPSIFLVVGFVL